MSIVNVFGDMFSPVRSSELMMIIKRPGLGFCKRIFVKCIRNRLGPSFVVHPVCKQTTVCVPCRAGFSNFGVQRNNYFGAPSLLETQSFDQMLISTPLARHSNFVFASFVSIAGPGAAAWTLTRTKRIRVPPRYGGKRFRLFFQFSN